MRFIRNSIKLQIFFWGFFLLSAQEGQSLPQPQEHLEQASQQAFRFSLIRIPVWVSDRKGRPIGGLHAEDFRLQVDNHPVAVASFNLAHDRPIDLVYLVDVSGSMEIGGKLEGTLLAMDFLLARHRDEDLWRLILFSNGQVVCPLDQRHPELWPELRAKIRGYGKTALYDALAMSGDYFQAPSANNPAILLFTDGSDNSSRLSEKQMLNLLRVLDVPVFVVAIADGFIPKSGPGEGNSGLKSLEEMSKITGGQLFLAKSKDQLPQIAEALSKALRPHYMLGITVERRSDEMRHRINVTLRKNRGNQLRFRTGYLGSLPDLTGGK